MDRSLLFAAAGTGFTFLMTALGSAVVLLFRKASGERSQKIFMGFASGVMIAASIWSLLIPCIDQAEGLGIPGYIPAAGGFALGVVFLMIFDKLINYISQRRSCGLKPSGNKKCTSLLISAITLHNIPEGMAVGLSFAIAAQGGSDAASFAPAIALALGIGIQNFPEGAAVSLPLKQQGTSAGKAFLLGSLSGIVEPIFGILTVLVSGFIAYYLPWLLSFAAGAMLFAVVKELIPGACTGKHQISGTMGAMAGFLIMMVLDITLG